ncbi:MAG: hypothetical protein ABI851_14810 [Saprospiraceae bacterium]
MMVSDLKNRLHQKIDLIEDENLLLEAIQLFDLGIDASNIILPEIAINKINIGIQDILSEKVKSHDQANLETEEWLREQ